MLFRDLTVQHSSDSRLDAGSDKVTMKSQFDACSYGKFKVSNDYGDVAWKDKMSSPGVLEVTIPVSLSSSTQSQMRANVAEEVKKKLGFTLPGPFAHVIFVIEDCYAVGSDRCGWSGTSDIRLPRLWTKATVALI